MDDRKKTILVVDDEESIRDVVSRRLQAEGYDCVTAADGKEALWKSFMQDFDLVLTDIRMSGMSGMEVLSQITNDHPDTGVVMITAVADTKTAVEAMKLGAYDYVTKPFNLDDLVMRVQRALERRGLVLENREYRLYLEHKVKRQVGQIQQYYREAIEALAREEMALEELNALRDREGAKAQDGTEVADIHCQSPSSIKAFVKKLSQMMSSPASGPLDQAVDAEFAQAQIMNEEPEKQFPVDQKERNEGSFALYDGTIELAIIPPVSLYQMLRLHEHLRALPQMQIMNFGGSVDKGITIRLSVESPTPFAMILRDLPEVESVLDESHQIEKMVPARRDRENPPVKRIAVELLKKSTTEAAGSTPGQVRRVAKP